jgi:hypothetical protein
MNLSLRSCLTAGIATITAAAVALGPAVQEPTPAATPMPVVSVASPPIRLAADVQPLAATDLPGLLVGWLQRVIVPPSAGQPFPTPQFPPVVAPTSIGSSIIGIYNAVEPWTRYIADVAAYAVGWIPYVGWLAPQITIFYNFGERIARSITYNVAYWLDGNISFLQGLVNVGVDTVNSFIQLGIDEWNFWLPPLPPLPPFPFAATEQTITTTEGAAAAADTTQVIQKRSTDEAPGVVAKKSEADAVKKVKEPKEPKTTDVSAQGEVRGAPKADTTNAPKNNKKGDKGPTAKGATNSSTSTADHTTKKNDDNGKKKADKE